MTTTTWLSILGGDWNTAGDWSAGVPTPGSTALLTVLGFSGYTVTSSQNNSAGTLQMAAGIELNIDSNELDVTSGTGTGALAGTISILGSAALGLGAAGKASTFDNTGTIGDFGTVKVNGVVTLVGNGTIDLDNTITGGAAGTLINGNASSANTIGGQGAIGESGNLDFVNGTKGTIAADIGGDNIVIDTKTFLNSGLVEANDGSLLLQSDITQTATGRLEALGSGSGIDLESVSIIGGTVSIAGGDSLIGVTGTDLIDPAKTIANAGTIEAEFGDLLIDGSVKNSSTGELVVEEDESLEISGTVTKGAADIYSTGEMIFGGPSSASVTFEPASFGLLVLDDAKKFTGTVAGMSASPTAAIDLENIAFDDSPTVSFAKGVLTVTDPATKITDKIKISGPAGTFVASAAGDGSTLISDPSTGAAGVAGNNTQLLMQAIASWGAGSGFAGAAIINALSNNPSSDVLAVNSSPPHHG